jgi:hypothetical protein
MFLSNVLRRMLPRAVHSRGGSRPAHSRRHRARPLVLEVLEDRCLLSSYSFALLADDGPHSFFGEFPAATTPNLNNPGTGIFRAMPNSGGEGVFTRDMQGNLGIIAITSDLISGFPTGGIINDAGTAAFPADLRAGGQAIFTGDGGRLSRIADTGPDSPFSGFLAPVASINNADTVAFRATLNSGGSGIFTERAGQPPSIYYVTGGRYAAFLSSNIQTNGSEVAFRATLSAGGDGVFLGNGLTTTTIATTGDTYSALTGGYANDAGTVVIVANLRTGGQAIVTGDGSQLTTLVDTSGPYSSFFGIAAINNDGQVDFAANLVAGGRGLFSVRDGVVDEIIGTGDSLLGSTVVSFPDQPFPPRALNNPGQLGFRASLADGRTVLVRADPDGAAPGSPLQVAGLISAIRSRTELIPFYGRAGVSVLVGITGAVQSPSIDTSALSSLGFTDVALRDTATVRPAEPVMASSSRLSGDAHDRVFAEFDGDWLSDALQTNLPLVG